MSLFSAEKKTGFHEAILFLKTDHEGTLFEMLETHERIKERSKFLIQLGSVYVNQKREMNPYTQIAGQTLIRVHSEPRRYPTLIHEDSLHAENDQFLILNKPRMLPTHATVDNAVENAFSLLKLMRPSILLLNRLDLETDGLLVFAKNKAFQKDFQKLLAERKVLKIYQTEVEGKWTHQGLLQHEMIKSFKSPKILTRVATPETQTCQLEVLEFQYDSEKNTSLLSLRLITGRSHQIRSQCAFEGHPLVGDIHYGSQFPYPYKLTCTHLSWESRGSDSGQNIHNFRLNSTN